MPYWINVKANILSRPTISLCIFKACVLRLPHRNDAKIAKICNLWTFWLVIQQINHLFKIRQKAFLTNAP